MRALALLPVLLLPLLACAPPPAAGASPTGADDGNEGEATAPGIPAKTVVLTFDDALRSHLEFVAPRLESHGFRATFFITAKWLGASRDHLTWEEVGELHRRGFEIGNHTWSHHGYSMPAEARHLARDLRRVEDALARVGVPRPVSFAWPGGAFGPAPRRVLEACGYRFARRAMQPEYPYGRAVVGSAYDPRRHDRLLVPATGNATRDWDATHFRRILAEAVPGRAVVLMFHGVPDPTNELLSVDPDRFREFLSILDEGGYRVLALRDLRQFGVLETPSADRWLAPRGQ